MISFIINIVIDANGQQGLIPNENIQNIPNIQNIQNVQQPIQSIPPNINVGNIYPNDPNMNQNIINHQNIGMIDVNGEQQQVQPYISNQVGPYDGPGFMRGSHHSHPSQRLQTIVQVKV